ncbi:MAG TPA: DUF1501 domain-containing protein [Planctomycetota bacterium]
MFTRREFVSTALALLARGQSRPPRAKRVIFLFQFGGPSQLDLFDPKPVLETFAGQEIPASIQGEGPISGLTREQKGRPIVPARFTFARHGKSGLPLSELLPHTAKIADELAMVRSATTDAVAHDPALLFLQTGTQLPGRPSAGSWVTYGLGSESRDLPAYVVLTSKGSGDVDTQPLGSRLWGSGFLPSTHQGVPFRAAGDPVLFLGDPPGVDRGARRAMLDAVGALNGEALARSGDPEIDTRIAQYELAFRMQASVPELLDLRGEPEETFALYGADARKPGTYAANCLLARRMAERGVRFIQLFHRGWDQHGDLPRQLRAQCKDTDQATAALVLDLKRRGLLEDTLIVWGGEFGRTAYCQGKLTKDTYGRDHHGRCFTLWMAGGGVKGGTSIGETDDFGYNVTRDPVPVRDVHATMLHLLGLDPERLVYRFQGLDQKLVGVEGRPKVLSRLLD